MSQGNKKGFVVSDRKLLFHSSHNTVYAYVCFSLPIDETVEKLRMNCWNIYKNFLKQEKAFRQMYHKFR